MLETLLRSDSNPCEPGKQLTGLSVNYKARVNWFDAGRVMSKTSGRI
jgi:hypothetical protein